MTTQEKEVHPKLRRYYEMPSRQTFHGNYCTLVPFDKSKHAAKLYHAYALDSTGIGWKYLTYGSFKSESQFLHWTDINCSNPSSIFYTVCIGEAQEPLGMLSLLSIEPIHGKLELGHIHHSVNLQQTTASTEAIFLIMRYIFDELGYRRLEWKCDNNNLRSKQSALRLGFSFEGIFRQHWIIKSHNRDTAWFSMLDKEWPAHKGRMQRWLSSNNFDKNGKQIKSLTEI